MWDVPCVLQEAQLAVWESLELLSRKSKDVVCKCFGTERPGFTNLFWIPFLCFDDCWVAESCGDGWEEVAAASSVEKKTEKGRYCSLWPIKCQLLPKLTIWYVCFKPLTTFNWRRISTLSVKRQLQMVTAEWIKTHEIFLPPFTSTDKPLNWRNSFRQRTLKWNSLKLMFELSSFHNQPPHPLPLRPSESRFNGADSFMSGLSKGNITIETFRRRRDF